MHVYGKVTSLFWASFQNKKFHPDILWKSTSTVMAKKIFCTGKYISFFRCVEFRKSESSIEKIFEFDF